MKTTECLSEQSFTHAFGVAVKRSEETVQIDSSFGFVTALKRRQNFILSNKLDKGNA